LTIFKVQSGCSKADKPVVAKRGPKVEEKNDPISHDDMTLSPREAGEF